MVLSGENLLFIFIPNIIKTNPFHDKEKKKVTNPAIFVTKIRKVCLKASAFYLDWSG